MHAEFEIRSADWTALRPIALDDRREIQTEQSMLKGDYHGKSAATESKRRGGADRRGTSLEFVTVVIIF